MNKQVAIIAIILITVATIGLSFTQATVINQLVTWIGGGFAVLVALSLFVVKNWPEGQFANHQARTAEEILAEKVRGMRKFKYTDEYIADSLNTQIDIIKSIPR
jgi:hypothetical protein